MVVEVETKDRIMLRPYQKNLSWLKDKVKIKIKETGKDGFFIRFRIGEQILSEFDYIPDGKVLLDEYYRIMEGE